MENALYIVLAITQVGLLIYYVWYSKRKKQKENERRENLSREYPYEGLRNVALNATPGALLSSIPEGEIRVYGVVMDWDMGNDIVTLVTQITGDASLYVKSGGGIIGAGKHSNVSSAAQRFTALSQEHLPDTALTTAISLPERNAVKFFFLTNKGKYTASVDYKNIEDKTSKWVGLFDEAKNVIDEMRKGSAAVA